MSSGTFSQIYIQVVFVVKGRENLLKKTFRDEVFKYMSGIVKAKGQKSIIINGVEDHVHLFIGLKLSMRLSDLVRDVKNNTTNFINEKRFVMGRFSWQEGYGAFSYSQSQIDNVYRYILNQERHHQKKSFKEEYIELLEKFKIDYKEEFLFEFYDEEGIE
ncbi:IS200/IS605 family transposase [Chryseobacterium sp. SNU WT5]|uniref:IS200/IS605 family transposase n=1 Tax=Chryseobacterium sp. SNU WT5 TaxID=2594269 RepID=UPI00117CA944|nr:IS200/IS605 family transposase [Chryseobacterium sp. SNU WT5]QDP84419.1 IS200/IS605 family transposase [Chryseobacterium sp. SNU WT5]